MDVRKIRFDYFIRKDDGSVLGACCSQDGDQRIYLFDADGSVKTRDDLGYWHEIEQDDARSLRVLTARICRAIPRIGLNYSFA